MSDLLLMPTNDGAEIVLDNGTLQTTATLQVAVYLSLFTPQSWGDMTRDTGRRYTSRVPEVMQRTVSNRTRLALIQAALDALGWMTRDGIADEVQADATVVSANRIDLTIRIFRPSGDADFVYAVNWDAQFAELKEME
jgi:phage gp46-like protein